MASQVTRAKKQQSRIIANFDGSYLLKILLNGNSFGADPEFEKWVDDVWLHQVNDVLEKRFLTCLIILGYGLLD